MPNSANSSDATNADAASYDDEAQLVRNPPR